MMSVVERNEEWKVEGGMLGKVTVWSEEGGDRAGLS